MNIPLIWHSKLPEQAQNKCKTYTLKMQYVVTALNTSNTPALQKCRNDNPSGQQILLSPIQHADLL